MQTLLFIGVCVALGAGGAFYYKSYMKPKKKRTLMQLAKSANTLSSCIDVLRKNLYIEPFTQDITQSLEQVERFNKKCETINDILLQKFSPNEMSYKKFAGVLVGVEKVVYINLRSILNKISAFDYEEYKQLDSLEWNNDKLAKEKMDIYKEYITFVDEATRDNEEILLKLDRLLLEVTHYNSVEDGDIMDMSAITELDELIKNAKLYR